MTCFLYRPLLRSLLPTLLVLLAAVPGVSEPATLRIDATRPGITVSPMLYGIFFEEINHAGDGGLYGELIENRSFEDDDKSPRSWTLITGGGAGGTLALDTGRPLNANNRRALRLEITDVGQRPVGVSNDGYWGIAVKRGDSYRLSFHARRDGRFRGPLHVRLEGQDGKVYARARSRELTTDWKQQNLTLRANATDPAARLVIEAVHPGTIWLDVVSLFPQRTWKNRPNGLRPDLAQKLAALRPAFLRFPGGCFVEGETLASAYRWKETIGPVEARPGRPNLWGYRSTDGLGYHEYLQMAEDLGAEPLLVVNCGMAHREVEPLASMQVWVQDALDALEYANGPVTSKWGALRAKQGHPKPFGLKYLEIGNENGGPAYNERYALLYDAVRARYPDVRIIANEWGGRPSSRPIPILDEHYYNSPDWFLENAHRYDTYDRRGPKIYVGEYAVTRNAGLGSLRAALAEAAFMIGMERNSDVVTMASYAPLFVNIHDRKWNPDLIGFDSVRSYGTPSYHVQKLFSQSRPDVVLPTTVTAAPAKPRDTRGRIGLGTWRTQAEFKDVAVMQDERKLLTADFAGAAAGWRVLRGDWKVENGAYRQTGAAENLRSVAGDPAWSDYTLTLRARKLGGDEGFLVLFRVKGDADWYWWNLGGWNNTRHAVERSANGAKSIVSGEVPGRIETGSWYDIKIALSGSRIRCYLDGKLIHDFEDQAPSPLHAVAGRKGGEMIIKVVNAGDTPQETTVTVDGSDRLAPGAAALVLSGRPDDENSVSEPTKVAPRTVSVPGVGPRFQHTFPPHSLTVLRIKVTGP